MASNEPMIHATSASGVTTDTQPVDAGSKPKKRKASGPCQTKTMYLVEVIETIEPCEALSKYLPMNETDPFAILMYRRIKKKMKTIWGKHGETRMDFELHGCDASGNEGDADSILEEELSRKEEKIFRNAKRKMKNKQVEDDDDDDDDDDNDDDDDDDDDDDADDYQVDLHDEWAKMMDAADNSTLTPYDARTLYGQLFWVRITKSEE